MNPNLTRREKEVAGLISIGLMNKEIAERLGISIKTVEKHRQAAYRKLGVDCIARLVRKVILLKLA